VHALTDIDIFTQILQQADDTFHGTEYLREISAGIGNKYRWIMCQVLSAGIAVGRSIIVI
jgi:hypothetical protein